MDGQFNAQQLVQLQNENSELKQEVGNLKKKLLDFKAIDEEITAEKVYEKAKKKITRWYSAGGIILFFVSIWGLKIFLDYTEELAQKKIDSITEVKLQSLLNKKAEEKLTPFLKKIEDTVTINLNLMANQRIREIIISTQNNINSQFPGVPPSAGTLPESFDLSGNLNPIGDQQQGATSVPFQICNAMEYGIFLKTGQKLNLSVSSLYAGVIQEQAGARNGDGISFSSAFKYAVEKGVVESRFWPYNPDNLAVPKSAGSATRYKVKTFQAVAINGYLDLKKIIASKKLIICGMPFYDTFRYYASGIIRKPPLNANPDHYQAVALVGYDDSRKAFKVRNTWGLEWGEKGNFYLGYDDILNFIREGYVLDM